MLEGFVNVNMPPLQIEEHAQYTQWPAWRRAKVAPLPVAYKAITCTRVSQSHVGSTFPSSSHLDLHDPSKLHGPYVEICDLALQELYNMQQQQGIPPPLPPGWTMRKDAAGRVR